MTDRLYTQAELDAARAAGMAEGLELSLNAVRQAVDLLRNNNRSEAAQTLYNIFESALNSLSLQVVGHHGRLLEQSVAHHTGGGALSPGRSGWRCRPLRSTVASSVKPPSWELLLHGRTREAALH